MGTSMIISSKKDILTQTFGTPTAYMPKDAMGMDIIDPFNHSLQWSRRSLGIRLYLSFLLYGDQGMSDMVQQLAYMGDLLKGKLSKAGWEIVNNSPFPVVVFTHSKFENNECVATFCQKLINNGEVWISTYPVQGKLGLRACITNYLTTEEHLDTLLQNLQMHLLMMD